MPKTFEFVKAMEAADKQTGQFMATVNKLTTNKGFLAFRRFLSGTDLWALINRFMGVLNIFQAYEKSINKQNTALLENVNSWKLMNEQLENLKINVGGGVGGFKSLLEMAEKLPDATDWLGRGQGNQFYGLMGGQAAYNALAQNEKDAINDAFKEVDIYEDLQKQYGWQKARSKVLGMLKPLAQKKKWADRLKRQEIQLDATADPISRWFKQKKFMVQNMIKKVQEFPWKVFGGSILKLMLWFSLIVVALYFLKGFMENAKETLGYIWEGIKLGFAGAGWFFSQALDGLGLIIDGIQNGSITDVLKGLFKLFVGIALGLLTLIGTVVLGVLVSGFGLMVGGLVDLFLQGETSLTAWLQGIAQLISVISFIAAAAVFISSGGWVAAVGYWLIAAIASGIAAIGLASGGKTTGGVNLVGEKGPELVKLPSGSTVYSNAQSRKMIGGNTIHVHVNGRVGASDAEIRDIANKVAQQINIRMNRTAASGTGF